MYVSCIYDVGLFN